MVGRYCKTHAAIVRFRMPLPAIHGDLMSARGQPGGKFFGEGLKSAVARGNAARAEDREPHRRAERA